VNEDEISEDAFLAMNRFPEGPVPGALLLRYGQFHVFSGDLLSLLGECLVCQNVIGSHNYTIFLEGACKTVQSAHKVNRVSRWVHRSVQRTRFPKHYPLSHLRRGSPHRDNLASQEEL